MKKLKQQIETFEQLRGRIGKQQTPSYSELQLIKRIFYDEVNQEKGEIVWGLMLVYLLGKVKGAGMITYEGMNQIFENWMIDELKKKNTSTTENSEGIEKLIV